MVVTDSRKLSKATAKLMASVKQGKDGIIEGKTRDQDAALIALGRVVGVFKDRQEGQWPEWWAVAASARQAGARAD